MTSTLELALAYIAKHPTRYIFPLAPMRKEPPLISDNLNNASNDPEQIKKWHRMCPGCGWGLSLPKSWIIVVDVDTKEGKVGADTFFDLNISFGFPKTEMVETPSGGMHRYYSATDVVQHVCRIGEAGFGPDIDSPNYVLIPGSPMPDGKTYTALPSPTIAPAPDWFAQYLAPKAPRVADATPVVDLDKPEHIDWAREYLINDAPPSIQGKGGEATMLKIGMTLRDQGVSENQAVDLIAEHFNVTTRASGKVGCDPLWDMDGVEGLERKIRNAYAYANLNAPGEATAEHDFDGDDEDVEELKAASRKARANDPVLAAKDRGVSPEAMKEARERCSDYSEVSDAYVWVVGPEAFIRKDKPLKEFWWTRSQLNSIYNVLVPKPKKGAKEDVSRILLNSKNGIAKYDLVKFRPGTPEVGNTMEWYNTWRPSHIIPAAGSTEFWDHHLEFLFPEEADREHLLNWCAWVYQNQALKPNHAVLLVGRVQGSGKSYIAAVMERLIGQHNTSRPKNSSVKGDFNGWAAQCKLAIVEELLQPGKLEVSNELRSLITEREVEINEKNVKPYKIENYMAMIATSNSPNAIHLDADDRRWLVLETEALKHEGETYYPDLFARLDVDADMAAVAHQLQSRDLRGYDARGSAPVTHAKRTMIEASLGDLDAWLSSMRDTGPLAGRVTCIQDIIAILPKRLERLHHIETTIGQFLKRYLKGHNLGQIRVGKERKRLWGINGFPKPVGDGWQKLAAAQYEKTRSVATQSSVDEAQSELGDE